MIVKVRSGINGAKVEVVGSEGRFLGWQASGDSPQQAIANLASEVRRAGFRGRIVVWR
ncbi:MAG: hypothetical protein GY842_21060 [bacterium]|nr:hypothetical protein [bacterium]